MVKTFIIDWPLLILIGLLFGYGVKGKPQGSVLLTRAFISGKFVITLFIIIVFYSYLLAPDWMWMYFAPAETIPMWIVIYVLIMYYFAYAVGFLLQRELAKISSALPVFYVVLMFFAEIGMILSLWDRYSHVGTLAEYQAGTAIPLAESAVGGLPSILTGILFLAGIGLIFWSRRQEVV